MRRLIFIVLYVVLLVASHVVRSRQPAAAPTYPGQLRVALPEHEGGRLTGRTIDVAYWDLAPPGDETASSLRTPVLVLHGSPAASEAMQPLLRELHADARLIAPDLPGMGRSTRVVADYSFDAHARSALDLLDKLGVPRVHLIAYSMGGGVALELSRLAPERVASITLISGLGVQELELLGDYSLNHTLHGLQYAALRALQELTPHFGVFDRWWFNTSYARNFLDSDQRPLRGLLERFAGPMLVVHGDDDGFVPVAAALEHTRLVPQSRLEWEKGGHLVVIYSPDTVAKPLRRFLRDVEAGAALTRATAEPGRVAAAAVPFDWRVHGQRGEDFAISAAVFLALATLASEDLACISGGLLVARGALGFGYATAGCLGGIVLGDVLLFLAGRWLGARALRRRPFRWFLKPEGVERCAALFQRRGAMLVLLARFMPGLRLPTYFAAGATGMKLRWFLLYFLIAAVVWTPVLVGAAALIGDPILEWSEAAGRWGWLVAGGGLLVFWLTARFVVRVTTRRGRRLLLGSWRRLRRWEYWPAWVIYPPVVVYILWLGIKHRGFTVFTAANPGIPCGGLAGESKSDILRAFPADAPELARFVVIAAHAEVEPRLAALDAFMHVQGLGFPVVLKPDVGERGQGVGVIADRAAAADYLRRCHEMVIAQEYVGGREFGLFYARRPSEPRGRIISITAKHLTSVRGDGTSTLEELILNDERAVCTAAYFLGKLAARLTEVPTAGEVVRLTELGTHCRGAVFTDGRDEVWSEALEARVDALSKTNPGFFFGRYDVRTPSAGAMRADGTFKVLELNGVSSEPTHMYDPRHSLGTGYRALFDQWRRCFAIGAENRARGARPAGLRELYRAVSRHLGRSKFEAR